MSVPVLIPTRQREHLLEAQVKAIREQEGDFLPYYLIDEPGKKDFLSAAKILRRLDVHYDSFDGLSPCEYSGAETKSYDYGHLANLWNELLKYHDPPVILVGSDVLPGERDTLKTMVGFMEQMEGNVSVTVPVRVNEDNLLNWWWDSGLRAEKEDLHRLVNPSTGNDWCSASVLRIAGGIIALNHIPKIVAGPGSEFYYLENPWALLSRSGINLRPGGERWEVWNKWDFPEKT